MLVNEDALLDAASVAIVSSVAGMIVEDASVGYAGYITLRFSKTEREPMLWVCTPAWRFFPSEGSDWLGGDDEEFDARKGLLRTLIGQRLAHLEIHPTSFDTLLTFDGGSRVMVFNASGGDGPWVFWPRKAFVVHVGSGRRLRAGPDDSDNVSLIDGDPPPSTAQQPASTGVVDLEDLVVLSADASLNGDVVMLLGEPHDALPTLKLVVASLWRVSPWIAPTIPDQETLSRVIASFVGKSGLMIRTTSSFGDLAVTAEDELLLEVFATSRYPSISVTKP